jgi:hypothetical protein
LAPLADDASGLTPLSGDLRGLTPLADDISGLDALSDDSAGLTPLADSASGPTPSSGTSPGLTLLPEDSAGLSPLPDAGGLTPLDDGPGLAPLNADPLGTSQTGSTPFSLPGGGGDVNPFSDAYAPAAAATHPPNPYQAPAYTSRQRKAFNEWVVKAPAIAIMVVSGLNIAFLVPYLIFVAISAARDGPGGPGNEAEMVGFGVGMVMFMLIVVAVPAVAIFAAWKMFKLESWGLALTSAILTMVSGLCCGIGFPVGIWALVVLCLSDVRNAFD